MKVKVKVTPFECYKTYIAMKQHFTKEKYDYVKYGGKSRASVVSFNKRKDRYFFERMSRKKSDDEITQYFISNFISSEDPAKVWIGEIIQNGETNFKEWQKRNQSLTYIFSNEIEGVFSGGDFDSYFISNGQHPKILKEFLKKNISIETLIILDMILGFGKEYDKKLVDPIWSTVSLKMKKYRSFLNISVPRYKKILKEKVL